MAGTGRKPARTGGSRDREGAVGLALLTPPAGLSPVPALARAAVINPLYRKVARPGSNAPHGQDELLVRRSGFERAPDLQAGENEDIWSSTRGAVHQE